MNENTQPKPADIIVRGVLINMKRDYEENAESMRFISGFVFKEVNQRKLDTETAMNIGYLLHDMIAISTAAACKD